MATLKEKFAAKIPGLREDIGKFIKDNGDKVISDVTVKQAYGGMRGVKGMVCDTSLVDPEKGLIIRGYPINELTDMSAEAIFYLLLLGEKPTKEEEEELTNEFRARCKVPDYVWNVLYSMPDDAHPMAMFNTAILTLERESVFRKEYDKGMPKTDYWDYAYEDSISLIAKLPRLAAGVYRIRYKLGDILRPEPCKDMGAAFVASSGFNDPKGELARLINLYLVLHSDHEAGNVSANTCHTVASALSDPYYAVSAGLNGLAGPLHGLANQENLRFILSIREQFGGVPTEEQLIQFAWDTLNSGKVIPGYGHAVLRATDPRFTALHAFGEKTCPDSEIFQIVSRLFKVIPGVLIEHGKAANPYPNVDAGSGSLLYHYGITESSFYTVLFGFARALGMTAQLIINRALGTPITRPKSVTTEWLKKNFS